MIEDQYDKHNNQTIKTYSSWSENLLNEKKLNSLSSSKQQIKCEFIPDQLSKTITTIATIANNTNNNNSQRSKDDSLKKSFLKSKPFKQTKSHHHHHHHHTNYQYQSHDYTNKSKSQNILSIQSGGSNTMKLSQKNNNNAIKLDKKLKSPPVSRSSHYSSNYKNSSSNNNNSSGNFKRISASASVTNISKILHDINAGKSTCSFVTTTPSSLMTHRNSTTSTIINNNNNNNNNNNVIKKFIHKIKTIV